MIDRVFAGQLLRNPFFVCGILLLIAASGAVLLDEVGVVELGNYFGCVVLAIVGAAAALFITAVAVVARKSRQ